MTINKYHIELGIITDFLVSLYPSKYFSKQIVFLSSISYNKSYCIYSNYSGCPERYSLFRQHTSQHLQCLSRLINGCIRYRGQSFVLVILFKYIKKYFLSKLPFILHFIIYFIKSYELQTYRHGSPW